MTLILGSQSPRRKEILGYFNLPFEQISSRFDERSVEYTGDPAAYAQTLAKGKGALLHKQYPDRVILSADTVVFKQGKLFNKPESPGEGFAMLQEFNGAWHTVYTAVSVMSPQKNVAYCEETHVLFHDLPLKDLELYHTRFGGSDMAGGYGIQMGGSIIVKRIEGCFYNVMGLPITAVREALYDVGIDLWDHI